MKNEEDNLDDALIIQYSGEAHQVEAAIEQADKEGYGVIVIRFDSFFSER